jgi:hypothetical protein
VDFGCLFATVSGIRCQKERMRKLGTYIGHTNKTALADNG